MKIRIKKEAGVFAEDKDTAARLREESLKPDLHTESGTTVLDFTGVQFTTQSFIHALLSEVFRIYGEAAMERLVFKGCSRAVKATIRTVVQYTLQIAEEEGSSDSARAPTVVPTASPKRRARRPKKK